MSKKPAPESSNSLNLLHLLAARLERLSADSRWAHRASGVRGGILKALSESEHKNISPERLEELLDSGFRLLREAAREIPDTTDRHRSAQEL